jgi:hypothetical protein
MSTPDVADLSTWTDLIRPVEDIAELRALLLEVVEEGIAAHPRSAQAEIGPSEVGDPCARKLAHKFAGTPRREQPPMWRAAVGTSIDAQLKDWCHAWNEAHGTRFLTDVKVYVGDLYPGRPVTGHLDVLDLWTATVVDVKAPGPTTMKKHKTATGGPERDPTYRRQKHLYGLGVRNAGFPAEWVAILRLPTAGELRDAIWTYERLDVELARSALVRAGGIAQTVAALGADAVPLFEASESFCFGCPFMAPHTTDLRTGCPGTEAAQARRATPPAVLTSLIA